jgi:hypothetical protein
MMEQATIQGCRKVMLELLQLVVENQMEMHLVELHSSTIANVALCRLDYFFFTEPPITNQQSTSQSMLDYY